MADRRLDRERQLTAVRALLALLDAADAAALPPLTWTVDSSGELLRGETESPADSTPGDTFGAWVKQFDLAKGQTSVIDGKKRVSAAGDWSAGPADAVSLGIMATIPRDDPRDRQPENASHRDDRPGEGETEGTPWH